MQEGSRLRKSLFYLHSYSVRRHLRAPPVTRKGEEVSFPTTPILVDALAERVSAHSVLWPGGSFQLPERKSERMRGRRHGVRFTETLPAA